jgi:uncharacterized protein YndB with AHSA1/START domain
MDPDRDGVVKRDGDTYEIVFVRRLDKPIEKVWAALTTPERLEDWLGVVTPEDCGEFAIVGGRFGLRFPVGGYRTRCQVVAVEPPRLFAWTWGLPDGPAQLAGAVRFELAPDGDGCVLTLTNPGLVRQDLESVAAGWHTHLEALDGAAEGVRTDWSNERERPHLERYTAALAALG